MIRRYLLELWAAFVIFLFLTLCCMMWYLLACAGHLLCGGGA